MASFNLTNFDEAMKHIYSPKKVENVVYQNNPLLSMIPKETSFPGRNTTYAIEYGMTSGRSANFQTAQNNRSGTRIQDFVVTRVKDYAVVSVDNETLLAADGNEGSLLDVAKAKTDSALHVLSRTMGRDIYRSGSGSCGETIGSGGTYSGTTLELKPGDAVNFEVGMRLRASAGDGDTLRPGLLEVIGIDRDADTLTTSQVCTTITGIADGDFLYVEGDAANGGASLKISGIDAWIPAQANLTSASFFGVDRTLDKTRLGGQRSTFNSSVHETLINAAVKVAREGGRPDALFMNPTDWAQLALDLEGKALITSTGATHNRRYDPGDRKAQFGFSSISVATPTGIVDVYADHNCPLDVGYLLQMDTWKFKSLGAAPRLLDFDGLKGIRQANEDGVEYRWGYYGNLICTAPGYNCRITLAA